VLFCIVLPLGLLLALRWEEARAALNLWLPAALLSLPMLPGSAGGFLLFLNISAILMLLALMAVLINARQPSEPGGLVVAQSGGDVSLTAAGGRYVWPADLVAVARPAPASRSGRARAHGVPVLLFFALLLASSRPDLCRVGPLMLRLDVLEDGPVGGARPGHPGPVPAGPLAF
jgi:hypothetical protein